MKEEKNNSRRKFLGNGLKIGLATAATGVVAAKALSESSRDEEMVELMTTDGTLIQVPANEVEEIPVTKEYNVREGYPDRKFVMVVDLAKCKNALKC